MTTGNFASLMRNAYSASGNGGAALVAAELLGEVAGGGQRVLRVAGDREVDGCPDERPDGRQRRVGEALAPGRRGKQPEPVQPGEDPRLRAHQPGGREEHEHEHRPPPRRTGLDHRRPDDHREVGDVDVGPGGEEREVEARDEQRRGGRADERRERGLAEGVHACDEHDERAHGAGDHDAIGAVSERRQQRAEGDRQRMLGRRAVGGERQVVQAQQLAAPQQRVVGVVVRIRRVDEKAGQRGERQGREADALEHARRQPRRPASRRGSLGG